MAPRKAGVSRKVRIAGPYTRPEAEAPCSDSPSTEHPSASNPPPSNQLLSLAHQAAARESAQIKYSAQLQSFSFIFIGFFIH
jgi:hypothetical protein